MRACISILFCLASAAALARSLDHYDPAALVAHARSAMREGDFRTACVLLSRAGQLAPHDARIALGWSDLEAAENGLPIREEPASKAEAATPVAPVKQVPPEPPAPWPVK
jgi:hypothetical protein